MEDDSEVREVISRAAMIVLGLLLFIGGGAVLWVAYLTWQAEQKTQGGSRDYSRSYGHSTSSNTSVSSYIATAGFAVAGTGIFFIRMGIRRGE